jgi:hypothetical protein
MKALPGSIGEYFALPPSDHCDSLSLVAGTAGSFPVPPDAKFAMFASTGDFFANYSGNASVPNDVIDGSASELNPTMRYVNGLKFISVIAAADSIVTVSYYT